MFENWRQNSTSHLREQDQSLKYLLLVFVLFVSHRCIQWPFFCWEAEVRFSYF